MYSNSPFTEVVAEIPFDDRGDEDVLAMGQVDEGAKGRAIVLIGGAQPVEHGFVVGERTVGVDAGAIERERADLWVIE